MEVSLSPSHIRMQETFSEPETQDRDVGDHNDNDHNDGDHNDGNRNDSDHNNHNRNGSDCNDGDYDDGDCNDSNSNNGDRNDDNHSLRNYGGDYGRKSTGGDLNEDYGYGDSEYGYAHGVGCDDGLGSDHGGDTGWDPDHWNTSSQSTPMLDEYRSEPEQCLQPDGEFISPPTSRLLRLINATQRRMMMMRGPPVRHT